jgi:hypothetical protein
MSAGHKRNIPVFGVHSSRSSGSSYNNSTFIRCSSLRAGSVSYSAALPASRRMNHGFETWRDLLREFRTVDDQPDFGIQMLRVLIEINRAYEYLFTVKYKQ